MQETNNVSPLFVVLLFLLRCLLPLAIMFGISYLLKRLGWITEPPKPPKDWNNGDSNNNQSNNNNHLSQDEGGLAHAKN
ncbi:MAG: hypothetical protein QME21_12540 [Anaerolineales bacterium]|nr:hypothetical protein [Anaerolineales bacterium]